MGSVAGILAILQLATLLVPQLTGLEALVRKEFDGTGLNPEEMLQLVDITQALEVRVAALEDSVTGMGTTTTAEEV